MIPEGPTPPSDSATTPETPQPLERDLLQPHLDAVGTTPPPSSEGRRMRGAGRAIAGILETLLATLIVFLLLQTFVGRTYAVEQTSMETTLEPGQRVIVDLLTPRFDPYKRGDIVVFTPPAEVQLGEPLIKRVIGVAGDTVELRDGEVFVNGKGLVEPYVFDAQPTLPLGSQTRWVVPAGDLFVLGDHRAVSRDSRSFGPISTSSVVGRAWLRFYPLDDLRILSGG